LASAVNGVAFHGGRTGNRGRADSGGPLILINAPIAGPAKMAP